MIPGQPSLFPEDDVTILDRAWIFPEYPHMVLEDPRNFPAAKSDLPVKQLVAGYDFTWVLLDDGRVRCWGTGVTGVVGYPLRGATHTLGPPAKMGDVHVLE